MADLTDYQVKILNRLSPAAARSKLGDELKALVDELEESKAAIANLGGADLTEVDARLDVLENPVSISSFSITNPVNPIEVGATLASVAFSWGITNYEYATSAKIRDISANVDIETLTAGTGTHTETVDLVNTVPTTQNYRLDVVVGGKIISSAVRSVNWYWATYHGNGGDSIDEAGVKALTKTLKSGTTGNFSIADAMGYKWIIVEKNLSQPTSFKDSATGFAVAMQSPIEITITNDQGITEVMFAYRTTNSFGGAITIQATQEGGKDKWQIQN